MEFVSFEKKIGSQTGLSMILDCLLKNSPSAEVLFLKHTLHTQPIMQAKMIIATSILISTYELLW